MKSTLTAVAVITLFLGCGRPRETRDVVSLVSTSPDGAYRVELVEWDLRDIDRNFSLRLTHVGDNTATNIFNSPDEGRPIGTERIVWSKDSSRFLLLGRNFFVEAGAHLTNGEAIYLLYEIKSGNLRCTAAQRRGLPDFSLEDVKNIDWHEGI